MKKDSKVKDGKFIVVTSTMIKDLNLKGNDLLIYAIIYGFSQTDGVQGFNGSLQYLADWTNSTKRGVLKNLQSLMAKGYITRTEYIINGVKHSTYLAVDIGKLNTKQSSLGGEQSSLGGEQSSLGVVNKVHWGGEQSSPNNIIYNIEDKIEESIEREEASPTSPPAPETFENAKTPKGEKKSKEPKHKYGEYQHILLTDTQYRTLVDSYGQSTIDWYIKSMDEWIQIKGKSPYKDFKLAILKWLQKDHVQPISSKYTNTNSNNVSQSQGLWGWGE